MPNNSPTQDLQQDIAGGVHAVTDSVRGLIDRGTERAAHIRDVAMERGRNAISRAQHTVEERPLMALGGAFVAGLLLGLWLRR